PARPITLSLLALSSSAASTCTAERTIKASALASSCARLPFNWSGVTTVHPGSRNKFNADEDIFSATTIFISIIPLQENDSLPTLRSSYIPTIFLTHCALPEKQL